MSGRIIKRVVCMRCKTKLQVSFRNYILYVQPCPKCENTARQNGYAIGYEDGYEQKLSDDEFKEIVEEVKKKLEGHYILEECRIIIED